MKSKKQKVFVKLYKIAEYGFWGNLSSYKPVVLEAEIVSEKENVYIVRLSDGQLKEVCPENIFYPYENQT